MTEFSANLGFLWTDRSLPDAIHAAKKAGFDAVECHWPYAVPVDDVKAALRDTSMQMLGLNTARGSVEKSENGLCAVPGREKEARDMLDESIDYAMQIGTKKIHAMAGFASGEDAHQQFIANLQYGLDKVKDLPVDLLIEPLNRFDAPDYFLSTTAQAESILTEVANPKLQLMFDCYHVQLMQGNLCGLFKHHLSHIGHVQFASVPDRGPPDTGEINFSYVFNYMQSLGYSAPLGAEYKPKGDTDASVGWLKTLA